MNHDLARARQGDRQAFETLVRTHTPRLLAWLRGRTPADIDAEDVLQEVFLSLYRNLDGIRDASLLNGWLFTATKREMMNRIRKKRTDDSRARDRALQPVDPYDDRHDLIHQAVGELPESLAEVVVTYYSSKMTYLGAGELLGLPPTTVQSRLRKAIGLLKNKLMTGAST